MKDKLLQAILSLDTYNRGYLEGVIISDPVATEGTYLGDIQILRQSAYDAGTPGVLAGFYAIAYQYEDAGVTKTVISYRGTDQFLTANGIGGGIINTQGAGADIATTAY